MQVRQYRVLKTEVNELCLLPSFYQNHPKHCAIEFLLFLPTKVNTVCGPNFPPLIDIPKGFTSKTTLEVA